MPDGSVGLLGPLAMQDSITMRHRVGALGHVISTQPQEVLESEINHVNNDYMMEPK